MATGVAVHLTNRSLMLVASFLLMPPHTWPLHTWGRFVVSSCTQPLAMGLALSLWDQVMFKVGVVPSANEGVWQHNVAGPCSPG